MYIVFGGDYYYPAGGAKDYIGSFDSLDDAKQTLDRKKYDWQHIFCTDTKTFYNNISGQWQDAIPIVDA